MPSSRVRVGVVGTSWWADLMHLPSLKSHPHADLVAICGRNGDRVRTMAEKYQIPQVFSDYHEMIGRSGIEAVVVSVPDDLHYAVSVAAIGAGLHVLCEKPLALSATQAKEMYERAEQAGVKHMTYFTRRWLPHFRYVHHLVQEGYVGRCLTAEFRYVGGWGRRSDYWWKFDPKRGLGALGDIGSHAIDMARWLVGEVSGVCATLGFSYNHLGTDGKPMEAANDSARLLVEFTNGCHGVINASLVGHIGDRVDEFRVILHGESGTIELDCTYRDGYRVHAARHGEPTLTEQRIPEEFLRGVDPHNPNMFRQVFTEHPAGCRSFVESILENREATPSFYDGWRVQEVMEAAIESDRSRKYVSL